MKQGESIMNRLTKLKALRQAAGLTAQEMSEFLGISKTVYTRIENSWERRVSKNVNERFISKLGESFEYLTEPADIVGVDESLKRMAAAGK